MRRDVFHGGGSRVQRIGAPWASAEGLVRVHLAVRLFESFITVADGTNWIGEVAPAKSVQREPDVIGIILNREKFDRLIHITGTLLAPA